MRRRLPERRAPGRFVFALPGKLATLTGGYLYDGKIIDGLRQRGFEVDVLELGEEFPAASAEILSRAGDLLIEAATAGDPIIVDGLALGVLPEAAEQVARKTRLIALVHHPLACEYGLPTGIAARYRASERRALAAASAVVATSKSTARLLSQSYAVDEGKIAIARPGTEPVEASRSRRMAQGEPVRLLSVGAISPRKGCDVLVAALSGLADLDWHLTIVGDETRAPKTSAALRAQIEFHDLGGRITLAGAIEESDLVTLYRQADVFVLASHFEGYGMAYAEAMAHGLPIIGTTGGAICEVVPPQAGKLVAPGDEAALQDALRTLITDGSERDAMAFAACNAARYLPRWSEAVDIVEALLENKKRPR